MPVVFAEKLRAVEIAKLGSKEKKYSGRELEKYVKVAAILQFTQGLGDSSVAMLSGKVLDEVGPNDAGKIAREMLEGASSGKK